MGWMLASESRSRNDSRYVFGYMYLLYVYLTARVSPFAKKASIVLYFETYTVLKADRRYDGAGQEVVWMSCGDG